MVAAPCVESSLRARVAFGPVMPGFGSWEWIGQEMAEALSHRFDTVTFCDEIPEADAVVFVKFRPEADVVREVSRRSTVVYCPVDAYGHGRDIDADQAVLSRCDRIVVHSRRLTKWFSSYAPTRYLDHHLRFTSPLRTEFRTDGPLLWVGVRSNLPPLAEWVNRHRLPGELWVLTNPERPDDRLNPADFGFRSNNTVRIGRWSPELQIDWTDQARAAFDIKGDDFRARHKPPVKAYDFLASGIPFAANAGSSPAEHLSGLGFSVASPDDPDRWLSPDYFNETVRFGQVLRDELGREAIAEKWAGLLESAIEQRRTRRRSTSSDTTRTRRKDPQPPPESSPIHPDRPRRVAVLSLLFNWPSPGGGTVHTFETAKFLSRAGHEVQHLFARCDAWNVGRVDGPLPYHATALEFSASNWNADAIRDRFRAALDAFSPDVVIVTDSWNTKPLLAEAAAGYPTFLRLAAQETLCPLNNVRLLMDAEGRPCACPRNQLATPDVCRACVRQNEQLSGGLHRAERALAGFFDDDYPRRLQDAIAQAEGVLAVNPAIADLVRPHAKAVHVLPSGFDAERFDLTRLDADPLPKTTGKTRLFFAGLTQEYMKGFPVLQAACEQLWQTRQDFDLFATGDPPGPVNACTTFTGWLSQDELPQHLRAADILVFPTIAEEALGRTAVEAMGCERPVVASRIGGLPFTVTDEKTGLLFEPGDANDLADKLTRLLDNPELRLRLGQNGRKRFEAEFTWEAIVPKYEDLFEAAVER